MPFSFVIMFLFRSVRVNAQGITKYTGWEHFVGPHNAYANTLSKV